MKVDKGRRNMYHCTTAADLGAVVNGKQMHRRRQMTRSWMLFIKHRYPSLLYIYVTRSNEFINRTGSFMVYFVWSLWILDIYYVKNKEVVYRTQTYFVAFDAINVSHLYCFTYQYIYALGQNDYWFTIYDYSVYPLTRTNI